MSAETPFDCTLKFNDGSNYTIGGCGNRPQLAFDPDGATPIGLFNGAQTHKPGNAHGEYTLYRPILHE